VKTWKVLSVAFAAIAAAALGIGVALHRAPARVPGLESGLLLRQPRAIADFSLTDQDGKPFDRARLLGHWTLVFVGFTRCPDVCPSTLSTLKQLELRLRPGPSTLFVSIDPERDTPETLKQYVRYFSPNLVGATGSAEQLERLCASLGVAYVKVPGKAPGEYTMDHTAALVLVNPSAQVAGYFQPPHRADTLANDLVIVMKGRA
jgi:protein SCO1/2